MVQEVVEMITYEPLYKTMQAKGFTTYTLINRYGISRSPIDRLKHNKPITTATINDLCRILGCGVDWLLRSEEE